MSNASQSQGRTLPVEKSFSERLAEAKEAMPSISPQAANERHEHDTDTVFIDPREASGLASTGIIPGALNLPLNILSQAADAELLTWLKSRTRPIITACQGGPMGAIAAHELRKRGFTNVHFVDGGTQGWLDAGYPTRQ